MLQGGYPPYPMGDYKPRSSYAAVRTLINLVFETEGSMRQDLSEG
jgi:hypothetical protein